MANETDTELWLIWSNEHEMWWAPNEHGYTSDVPQAGRYHYADALKICQGACFHRDWTKNEGGGIPPEVMVPSPEMIARRATVKVIHEGHLK